MCRRPKLRHLLYAPLLVWAGVISQMFLVTGVPVWISAAGGKGVAGLPPCCARSCGCSYEAQSVRVRCCCQSHYQSSPKSQSPSTVGIQKAQLPGLTWLVAQQMRQCRGFQDDGGFPLIFSPPLLESIARVMTEPVCVGWLIPRNELLVQCIHRPDIPPPRN
ncbi:MAG: hypothetical protein KatS3mg107_0189 [Gemmataceae bacterium]|nr:MAG: hypothetical protein KatS3mg107_0189 [Gemmataceae bacterium]